MPLTRAEGEGMMSEQHQDEVTLRELAIRLLSPRYPGVEHMQVTDLLPGQLPPNPPIELALPSDARLIGSVIRGQDSTTLFDTDLSSEELLAFYRERMTALGWAEQEQFPPPQEQSGFVHAMPQQMAHALFFATSHGPLLRLSGLPSPAARIEAQLALEMNPSRQGYGPLRRQMVPEMDLLPPLLAPEGAQQRALSGGGGGGEWRSNAELTTDLDLTAVTTHYTRQFAAAGWQAGSPGAGDRVHWSVWDFADKDGEPWRAYLFVFQRPDDPTRYFLDIHCQWAGDVAFGGGGWSTSYAPLRPR
jgi:hypothetical protein